LGEITYLEFGPDAQGLNSATLDIAGHEFTHGVVRFSANLNTFGESGALIESFCDIFGTMIEDFSRGSNNWTIGEDASTIRDMHFG
jgi:Zn-dependent metalloprotease